MSKTALKKQHWRSHVQDSFIPLLGSSGELGIAVGGGADYGEFPFVTSALGGGLTVGDIVLEIGGTPVLGMTLGDVRGVLNSCPHPIRIKTVSPGFTLCKDLRLYLSKCFTPGSVDSQLQQVIRENLYLRALPCTTRQPRDGEISGVDYNFVSIEEFFSLEESGALLESGKFKGNYYGTPRPVHVSADSPPITYQEHRNLLRNFRTRSKSLSNLEKAAEEGDNSEEDSGFTDQPGELRGFPVRAHLTKGSRGFGFNIVGGSKPDEFLQVYSVTSDGPSNLKTADILVYVNDACVLGASHREVVEMLKSVPVGHGVDVEVRRGYPMLYNYDGCPKQQMPGLLDSRDPVLLPTTTTTTTQPQPRLPTPTHHSLHFDFNEVHSDGGYMEPGPTLDSDRNLTSLVTRQPPSYRRLSMNAAFSPPPAHHPRSPRGLARLQSLDPTLASQSDSEVVSAIGSHRASMIRNHNNNSLSAPPHPFRYGTSKSSESDLSTCTLSGPRLPLPHSPGRPTSSPGGPRGTHSHLFIPQTSRLRTPSSPDGPHHRHLNGFHPNSTSPTASPNSASSPGATSGGVCGGELVPVVLAHSEGDQGLGFSLTAGGPGARMTIVKRVWDRKQCNSLQPGDAIIKINGADIQSLSFAQSTSFLESVPVTLTMEPKDWINTGLEDEAGAVTFPNSSLERQGGLRPRPLRGFDVELRRKAGEGFGFVIASQDVKNGKAASLLPHRFVTVRRGSPAAKSGQIRAGDRLEAVEGRSVVTLPHRELAQILRRAGNTLRLTIIPRPSTYSSSLSEPEYDAAYRSRKGQRLRPKRDSRYYSVDLERGPSGFGFSLRGGSEYNMGLYVLGLMGGGPASRSHKMEVSDQLVEINGNSTAGMTHSQAVEQIRRGGHHIHLVLKRGNGYVPDYGREHRITSPSRPPHPKEQGLAAVGSARQKRSSAKQKKRSRSANGHVREKRTGRRHGVSEGGSPSDLQSPNSEVGEEGSPDAKDKRRSRRRRGRKQRTQSLPRDALRNNDESEAERETVRGRKKERKSKRRPRKSRSARSLPTPKQDWEAEERDWEAGERDWEAGERDWEAGERDWEVAAGYREVRREELQVASWEDHGAENGEAHVAEDGVKRPLPAAATIDPEWQEAPPPFLTATSMEQRQEGESDSGGSQSDASMSAASISGLSLAASDTSGARMRPGPWLRPSQQKVAEVTEGGRLTRAERPAPLS
eukprot:XP_011601080.1 PREDICTED: PDZ domain-containing protein MAGIX [Takifugu rubripes]